MSDKPFKSSLVAINKLPGVTSVDIDNDEITANFENLDVGTNYYYDVTLERKASAEGAPLESYPLVKEKAVPTGGAATVPLKDIEMENVPDDYGADKTYDMAEILASGDWYARVTLRTGKEETYSIKDNAGTAQDEKMLVTDYVDDKISASHYTVTNTALPVETNIIKNLTATSGGNQSIDVSWTSDGVPEGSSGEDPEMEVRGYHITVYTEHDGATGPVASRTVTDEFGEQTVEFIEYDLYTGDAARYDYNLPSIPAGSYQVGVTPLYADVLGTEAEPKLSAVARRGTEQTTGPVTIAVAIPPVLSLRVTGAGNITRETGSAIVFVGADAELIAEAADATVTITEYDGTAVGDWNSGTNTLSNLKDYVGKTLLLTAENTAGDSVSEFITIYPAASAPLLLPDNYDQEAEVFLFPAYKDTGTYTITGQTDPGAELRNAAVDENGQFAIAGALDSGVDELSLTLAVTDAAGTVTMREVLVQRGDENQPVAPPSGGGSAASASISVSAATYNSADSKDIIVTLNSGNRTLSAIKNGGTTLIKGVDYTVSGNTVTIKAEYLASLAPGEYKLTFDMSGGTDPVLALTVEDGGAAAAWENHFADVTEDVWYYADVQYVVENGLFNGTSATTFSPQTPMTRGMLVTVLGRLNGADASAYTGVSFGDVDASQYCAPYVEWAKEQGIVTGIGGNQFAPDAEISRQDLAVILFRYAEKMGIVLPKENALIRFADEESISEYAKDTVAAMQQAGITNGKPGNIFDPEGSATRAEVAAMLHRFAEAVK